MILRILILLALALPALAKPNIVMFVTDDQSPIAGCYGSKLIQTPNLDALAAEGTLFTNAFATTASCSASRSVILTGIHNHANGQYGHVHHYHHFETYSDCAAISLPNQLRLNGYRTAHIGKYHVAPEVVYSYDTFLKEQGGGHNTPAWVESCKPLFEEKSDKPFFLTFWTHDPHRSGGVVQSAPEELKPNLFGNPQPGKQFGKTPEVSYDPAEVTVPEWLPDTIECRREIAQYYQSCTRTDRALGALVQALKDAGQYENTMIIYTADHGMAFPGAKTTIYEAGLRVPFIVRMPGQTKAVVNHALISHADITPSLLDAAGGYDAKTRGPKQLAPTPEVGRGENKGTGDLKHYQGRSWVPILNESNPKGWDTHFASHTFHEIQMYYPMRAIRDRQFKLIWNIASPLPYPFASDLWAASSWQAQFRKGKDAKYGHRSVDSYIHRPAFELYDLKADPSESNNLADEPKFAEQLERMKEQLKTAQKRSADPWLLKWRYE